MSETWEQTKSRFKKKGFDVQTLKPLSNTKEEIITPPVQRFNVYKRSLPTGLDKIVLFSVTKDEAKWWVDLKLKTKVISDNVEDTRTIVYYDIIPTDATVEEASIYFNPRPTIKEEKN